MLVDSNIIIYAINESSPKHKSAQKFIQTNKEKLYTAHQNIFESLRVLTHPEFPNPMKPLDAITAIERIISAIGVISPTYETRFLAIELIKKYKLGADKVFDAYLAATAVSNNLSVIVTDNTKDFLKINLIRVYNPFLNKKSRV